MAWRPKTRLRNWLRSGQSVTGPWGAPASVFRRSETHGDGLASFSVIPGGIFSPSLAIGAGIGFNLSALFASTPVAALVLLGMVPCFVGVVQAPITSFVIVTEMTNDHAMVVPLMAAAFIARATWRLICRGGVYHALSKNFLALAEEHSGKL